MYLLKRSALLAGLVAAILTSSEADLLEEVDDGVPLQLPPPGPGVGVHVVALATAVQVV